MNRRVAVVAGVFAVVAALLPAVGAGGAAAAAEPERLAGASRFATSVAIAQRSFPDGADVVYLARGDQFADALAAGTLTDGPVLLVPSCGEPPPETAPEIARLDPDTVIALGGANAVCDTLLSTLADGRATDRLAADDRFGTAAAIATRAFPTGAGADVVYVADAADSPDAVAGGALTDGPILLVPSDGAPPATTTAAIAAVDPDRVVALGGATAIAEDTLAAAADGRPTSRLAGDSRFDTAAAIAAAAFPAQTATATAYLARGDVFADAVASGSLADGPVLLVGSCGPLPPAVTDYLTQAAVDTVVALGGTQAVCDQVLTDAANLPDGTTPPPEPTPDPDPTPTPEPPGPTPQPGAAGTLYVADFLGDLISIDMADLTKPRTVEFEADSDLNVPEVHGVLGEREFVYTTSDFNVDILSNEFEVVVRDLDDKSITAEFPWLTKTDEGDQFGPACMSAAEPSPDGQYFIAVAWYGQSCSDDAAYIEVMRRDGQLMFRYPGNTFADWAWTPDGDLLATVTEDSAPIDDGAALVLLDREGLLAGEGQAEIIQTFPGGDETPTYLSVSSAGDQIAYSYVGDRSGEFYVMPFEAGGEGHWVAHYPDKSLLWAEFSPDDEQIVIGVFEYRAVSKDYNSSVLIPNHRDPEPILLNDGSYALEVPQSEGGSPDSVDPQGPFFWDSQ